MNEAVHGVFPGVLTIAEESTSWPMVSRPTYAGGLGFSLKWNMGWMHDSLNYMAKESVHRKFHQGDITFSLLYAFSENFVLPLSHDEVVHMKGSLIQKMSGDEWQKFANLRAYYGLMWSHPGKKLLFMGGEFAQWQEWNFAKSLEWDALSAPNHQGVRKLVQDLNRIVQTEPALYEDDFEWTGFTWIDASDTENSVLSFLRNARRSRDFAVVVCNFTPVPRRQYRIGVPRPGYYRELINTDATEYWGSGVGNNGGVPAADFPWHGHPYSLVLTLPPLATLILKVERADGKIP
jgi:1,4-alpha-glucan branching enzyme